MAFFLLNFMVQDEMKEILSKAKKFIEIAERLVLSLD
jgi:hypothetical protein